VAVLFRGKRCYASSRKSQSRPPPRDDDMSFNPSNQGSFRKSFRKFGRRLRENFGTPSLRPSLGVTNQPSQQDPPASASGSGITTSLEQTTADPDATAERRGYVAWAGLETALRLLKKSSDVFPPLGSAIDGLLKCLDIFEVMKFIALEYLQ
jgi:hypothetical protein